MVSATNIPNPEFLFSMLKNPPVGQPLERLRSGCVISLNGLFLHFMDELGTT